MCYGKHIDMKAEMKIFGACRNLLCQNYDEDIDLELVCYLGKRARQDKNGRYYLVELFE
jgi:hypothetical protein